VQPLILWTVAAGMALLGATWGFRNKRAGYRRPARRPLLEEGFRLLRLFERPEPLPQTTPASPPVRPKAEIDRRETPVEQLVSLSLAMESTAPTPETLPQEVEEPETIHSPT